MNALPSWKRAYSLKISLFFSGTKKEKINQILNDLYAVL